MKLPIKKKRIAILLNRLMVIYLEICEFKSTIFVPKIL